MTERIISLVNRLEVLYRDEPWFGESILVKLERLNQDQVFTRPLPHIHAVAELVSHMIYWRQALIRILEKDPSYKASMESPENWRSLDELKKEGWKQLWQRLDDSQTTLTGLLKTKTDAFLDEPYKKKATNLQLVEGVIDHDVYHLGQIALVARMLESE